MQLQFHSRVPSELARGTALLFVVLGVTGCDIVLGTNQPRFAAECETGERRCVENQPQECGEDLEWHSTDPCSEMEPVCVEDDACSAVSAVSAGAQHSCAIVESDGSVRCWGRNTNGELGDGSQVDSSAPVLVTGLQGAVQVVLGGYDDAAHSCALLDDGRVACWGSNDMGQAGGAEGIRTRFGIIDGISDARALSLGTRHTCAVLGEGTVKCWGWPLIGDAMPEPTTIVGLDGVKVVDVAAGGAHTCALTADGRVFCWGLNHDGQCGQETGFGTYEVLPPMQVPGIMDASAVAVGYYHTCALMGGQLRCWGRNDCGQLGRGTVCGEKCTIGLPDGCGDPVPAPANAGLSSDEITNMDLGSYHSCVLVENGTVYCVGRNDFAQASPNGVPVPDHGDANSAACIADFAKTQFFNARQISVGTYHDCLIEKAGSVKCWGRNDYGQLGNSSKVDW